jgi:hypothetical protein
LQVRFGQGLSILKSRFNRQDAKDAKKYLWFLCASAPLREILSFTPFDRPRADQIKDMTSRRGAEKKNALDQK